MDERQGWVGLMLLAAIAANTASAGWSAFFVGVVIGLFLVAVLEEWRG